MKLLTITKHTEVVYTLKDTNYPKIYAKLSQILDEKDLRFFASVEWRQSESRWSANYDGNFVKYTQLSDDDKELVSGEIQYLKTSVKDKLATDPQLEPYVDDILNVPDEDSIFVSCDDPAQLIVTLTGWGCAKYKSRHDFNPLGRIVELPKKNHTQVDVQITYSDGSLYAKQAFYFFYKDRARSLKTDEKGGNRLGVLKNDTEFTVSPTPEISPYAQTIRVVAGQTLYPVTFPFFTSAHVKVVDQIGQDLVNEVIVAEIPPLAKSFTTDANGSFVIENIELTHSNLKLSLASNPEIFQEYVLNKTGNNLVFKITRTITRNPVIRVINKKDNEPVADYMLKIIVNEESEKEMNSNADGNIILDEQRLETKIFATDSKSEYNNAEFVVTVENNRWDFPVDLPEEKFVRVKLLDIDSKLIPNHPIDIIIDGKKYSRTTDAEGYVTFSEKLFKHKQKVKVEIPLLESDLKKK